MYTVVFDMDSSVIICEYLTDNYVKLTSFRMDSDIKLFLCSPQSNVVNLLLRENMIQLLHSV